MVFHEAPSTLPVQDQIATLGEQLRSHQYIVAIDGPGGGGKGTLTAGLIETLQLQPCPTGDMYRGITYYLTEVLHCDPSTLTDSELSDLLNDFSVSFEQQINAERNMIISSQSRDIREDVTDKLHDPIIGQKVSAIAKRDPVRDVLDKLQLDMLTRESRVIIEGRDMWKIARQYADVLIYLYARDDVLIAREIKRQKERNINLSYDQAAKIVIQRNKDDNNRERGKLLTPQEAQESGVYDLIIDTSDMTPEQILFVVLEKLATTIANDRKTK